jgi:hypothetical protein
MVPPIILDVPWENRECLFRDTGNSNRFCGKTSVESACRLILGRTFFEMDVAQLLAELPQNLPLLEDGDVEAICTQLVDGDDNNRAQLNPDHHAFLHVSKWSRWINHAGLGFEAGLVDNATRELKGQVLVISLTPSKLHNIFFVSNSSVVP